MNRGDTICSEVRGDRHTDKPHTCPPTLRTRADNSPSAIPLWRIPRNHHHRQPQAGWHSQLQYVLQSTRTVQHRPSRNLCKVPFHTPRQSASPPPSTEASPSSLVREAFFLREMSQRNASSETGIRRRSSSAVFLIQAKCTVMGGQQVCNQTFRPDDDGMCGRPAPPHLAVSSLMNARICDDYTGWPMRHP